MDALYFKYQIIVALGLVLLGLAAAMAHLGTPTASIHAARNIKRSWLSREITAVNCFAVVLVIIAALTFTKPELLNSWIMLAESLIGGMALFAMTRVYLLRTVPAWNHVQTPLSFLGSALLLGAVLFSLYLSLSALVLGIGPGTKQLAISRHISFAVITTGLTLKVLAAKWYPLVKAANVGASMEMQPVMQTIGFSLWLFSILPAHRSENLLALLSLAAFFLVAGEIIHRIKFYNSYQRVGL